MSMLAVGAPADCHLQTRLTSLPLPFSDGSTFFRQFSPENRRLKHGPEQAERPGRQVREGRPARPRPGHQGARGRRRGGLRDLAVDVHRFVRFSGPLWPFRAGLVVWGEGKALGCNVVFSEGRVLG